ncbi:MAG: hypothetical protein Q4G20_00175 [Paracoccus sp. (in: a-proteobacteria)]|nr:hypothetical protein [Paracoccus sp. (in: a-proteobacteria)]MDO5646326.1 hypothetical protein [Paracoccus sp. (in: a-proteobacteria)]
MGVVGEPKLARDRKRPKSGNYYIYWTDEERGSLEKSLRTKDRAIACEKFEEWKLLNLGQTVARRAEDVKIAEVLRYYEKIKRTDVSAPERISDVLKALTPYWGNKPVSAVNKLSCIRYREERESIYAAKRPARAPLSPNTVRRELAVLSAAIKVANDDGLINRQVTVHRPREVPVDVPYFTCTQALRLIRVAPKVKRARQYLQLFLILGFLTGDEKSHYFRCGGVMSICRRASSTGILRIAFQQKKNVRRAQFRLACISISVGNAPVSRTMIS